MYSATAIHKTGDPSNFVSYRPISILPHLSKMFESKVYSCINKSLNYIVINQQYSFRPGKSTATSRVVIIYYILVSLIIKNRLIIFLPILGKLLTQLTMDF